MIFLADMAFLMSDFDDLDDDQISWKLGQGEYFVFAFVIYVADIAILMSNLDNFDNDQISWKLAQR